MYRRLILFVSKGKMGSGSYEEGNCIIFKNNCIAERAIPRVAASPHKFFSTSRDESSIPEEGDKKSKEKEKGPAKSGKENLLDLLGAMKVEVTTKKKFQAVNVQKRQELPRVVPRSMESASSMFQKASPERQSQSVPLSPELVAAASAVASSMLNKSQTESELLQQLRKHETIVEDQKKTDNNNIGNIIADMKVGKRPNARSSSRPANQIRFDDDGRGFIPDRGLASELEGVRRRRGLFVGKRLNIFPAVSETTETETKAVSSPTLWDMEMANQIATATRHLPRNGFEEMIQWTREGKLWLYPINNEQGLEEEAEVPFHEHVFLDKHLEDFPKQGPIRHFMELVITGLSKNPHLTVHQKKEHIAWFRDYFQQKEELLTEAEAGLH